MADPEAPASLLIVDDEPINIQVAASYLKTPDLKVSFATSAAEALQRLEVIPVDMLLLDVMMPDMDGLELCRQVKARPEFKDIPVLFLTAKTDKQTLLDAFQAGAADYIAKPFFAAELQARVRAHLKLRELQKRLEANMNELNLQILKALKTEEELLESRQALTRANQILAERSQKDALTGLCNRRRATELMEYEDARNLRQNRPLGLLLLDLDHFKLVNDNHGHETGDRVLIEAAKLLTALLRQQDTPARWGGEEFIALLPETDLEGTRRVAEKVRRAFEQAPWGLGGAPVTVSIGYCTKNKGETWKEVLARADRYLYSSKNEGRNRITGPSEA